MIRRSDTGRRTSTVEDNKIPQHSQIGLFYQLVFAVQIEILLNFVTGYHDEGVYCDKIQSIGFAPPPSCVC